MEILIYWLSTGFKNVCIKIYYIIILIFKYNVYYILNRKSSSVEN